MKHMDAFYLKGLVSASEYVKESCDTSKYSLYTNIGKFTDWIKNPTKQHSRHSRPKVSNCGIMSESTSLVQNGEEVKTKEFWPWVVAIMIRSCKDVDTYDYWASGTLITEFHVITTGSSVAYLNDDNKIEPLEVERIRMMFGVNDLNEPVGSHSLVVDSPLKITLHSNIKSNDGMIKTANIALITLKDRVHFTNFISLACLAISSLEISKNSNSTVYAVGYGKDESGAFPSKKKFAPLKLKSQRDCQKSYGNVLRSVRQTKYFCAGGLSINAACAGDTAVYIKQEDRWYLQGFMSMVDIMPNGLCNGTVPALYEDVGQYSAWITTQISKG